MKSTWFGDERRKQFVKLVHEADYGLADYDKYRTWLGCAFTAIRQPCHKLATGQINDNDERRYLKSIKTIKHPDKFGQALGVLTEALDVDGPDDFLGAVLSEWGQNDSKWRGQLFTPTSVSELIARMTLSDVQPEHGKTLWLAEPACGAGSMIIAASNVLKDQGFYPWHYHWSAWDVDWKCFAMTFIQTTLLGIPCHCVHGNTLSMEVFDQQRNFISLMHPPKPDRDYTCLEGLSLSIAKLFEGVSC